MKKEQGRGFIKNTFSKVRISNFKAEEKRTFPMERDPSC